MAVQGHSPNSRLALRAIEIASTRELDGFRDVCAPDVVLSFPFHPNGAETHHGVEEMIKQFSVEKAFQTFSLEAVNLYDNGEVIVVEGRSHGTYKSGRPDYRNHYIFVIQCKDGRITHWNEFFNPLEAMKQNYGKPKPEKAVHDE
ncbi:nuclear transport factor 2 family protein [Sphingobium sp. AN558]|uniref:nuclear transport factor 2 family protein n=1 Tax=Sphingobium sp. AN558 TaxID=3133442 RepID=UPI0030C2F1AE